MDQGFFNRKNYLLKVPYIFSSYIREYDISKANINILLSQGIINIDQYNYYMQLPKQDRQYQLGMLQKNKNIEKALNNGLSKYRKLFIESNNISIQDILSVKNDAIFLINKIANITKFDNVEFLLKNTYTSYIYLQNKIEVYYSYYKLSDKEIIDIKGINDNTLKLHENYMLDFISYILYILQTDSAEKAIDIISIFYNDYVNRKLDIGYYREFNASSGYMICTKYQKFLASNLDNTEYNKRSINISYNMNIIIEIYKYISSIYFNNHK